MKNLSASKTLISLAVSSIFISHSAFAAVIFDDPNQDYVHQGGDLLINGGDSTLNAKSVNLGGGQSLLVIINSYNASQGYSGKLSIETGDLTVDRIRTNLETTQQNSINYETSIIANGTTTVGTIDINSLNQYSSVTQKFTLETNTLNINTNEYNEGISLSAGPEGSNPQPNHQLESSISAQTVNVHSQGRQAINVDGVDTAGSATLSLTGEYIALSGGHSFGGTYADNIAVYATQAGVIDINVGSSLDIQTKQFVDASEAAFCGNVALYAKGGQIAINGEQNASISTIGGLVAYREGSSVKLLNVEGSKTEINGDINALVGGEITVKANNALISSQSIYVQNGLIDIELTSDNANSIGGIRGALAVEYGDTSYGNSDIRVKMSGASNRFIGTSQIVDSIDEPHSSPEFNHIDLTLENGAAWDVQSLNGQNNYVSTLALNNGILNLRYQEDGSDYKTVDVNTFSGTGGLILFNAELTEEKEANNHLEIQTALEGTHRIHVNSASGSEPTKLEQEGYLVRVINDQGATFVADNNKLEYGVYFRDYSVKSRINENSETEWYLTFDPQPQPDLTPSGEAVVALAGMGAQNAIYLNQLSDVRQRLGEIRNGVKDGVWASVAAQKDRISGFSSTAFDQEAYRFNFGFDRSVGQWLIGANIKAITANQETKDTQFKADGDAHSEGINLYATWYNNIGCYVDFVLSLDRYHQEIENRMLNGTKVRGDYNNIGLGASIEGGRKFSLGGDKSLFIEPQAQLSYYWMKGDDFSMSNAMEVRQENFDSLTGRLGFVAGKDFIDSLGNNKGQLYARLGVNHEFLGDQNIRVNDIRFSDDLLGTRIYYGLAGEWRPYENIKFFGYIEREDGSDYTKEFEVSAGIKYTF